MVYPETSTSRILLVVCCHVVFVEVIVVTLFIVKFSQPSKSGDVSLDQIVAESSSFHFRVREHVVVSARKRKNGVGNGNGNDKESNRSRAVKSSHFHFRVPDDEIVSARERKNGIAYHFHYIAIPILKNFQ